MRRHRSRFVFLAMKSAKDVVAMAGILVFTLITLAVATLSASSAELKGLVINGTTRKPAAGDEVMLLTLSDGGMGESARTNTDSTGHFSFVGAGMQSSQLVRVVHQGVTYHQMAKPGARALAIEVYDVAEKLEGVTAIMDVQRFEATSDTLEVKQLVTVRNASQPPRTLSSGRGFEFPLPPQAQVQSGLVQVGEEEPLKQRPLAGEQKGQYYFVFPIRPGDTRFAVVYKLPYRGDARIEPGLRNSGERFVIMLPKSMTFEPKTAGIFRPMPGTTPDNVLGTAPVMPVQAVGFRISGTGMLEELQDRRRQAQDREETQKSGPGGGLGRPIEAPDPLQEYRWPILAVLAGLTGMGAVCIMRATRQKQRSKYEPHQASGLTPPPRVRRNGRRRRRTRV